LQLRPVSPGQRHIHDGVAIDDRTKLRIGRFHLNVVGFDKDLL